MSLEKKLNPIIQRLILTQTQLCISSGIKQEIKQGIRKQEQAMETLQKIAFITSSEFAQQAADTLDSKRNVYDMDMYLILLEQLQQLILAGVPNFFALYLVHTYKTEMLTKNILELVTAVNR